MSQKINQLRKRRKRTKSTRSICPPTSSIKYNLVPTDIDIDIDTENNTETETEIDTTSTSKLSQSLALIQLASTCARDSRLLHPNLYLKAAGETIFCTLLISWCLTSIYHPEVLIKNVLKDRLGYNNPCVGWDFAPGSYVGLVGCIIVVYFVWSYVKFDIRRIHLRHASITTQQSPPSSAASSTPTTSSTSTTPPSTSKSHSKLSIFTIVVDLIYACQVTLFPLIFLIGPTDSNWNGHTFLFMQVIIGRYLVCLAAYWNVSKRTYQHLFFIVFYGFISISFPVLVYISFSTYSNENRTGYSPVIPPWILGSFDAAWFLCLILTNKLLPVGTALFSSYDLSDDDRSNGNV